jgi:hypothetical protein
MTKPQKWLTGVAIAGGFAAAAAAVVLWTLLAMLSK